MFFWSNLLKITQNINSLAIKNHHINQLVDLVMTTDHFQYYGQMSTLSSDYEFVKTDFVMPYINHINMALDELNNVVGFYVAITKECDCKIIKDINWNRADPNVKLLFNAENNLMDCITDDDYFLCFFAIRSDLHGVLHPTYQKKMSHLLLEESLYEGYQAKATSLAILTWESHVSAIKLYARFGGKIVKSEDLRGSIFEDRLLLMKIPIVSRFSL